MAFERIRALPWWGKVLIIVAIFLVILALLLTFLIRERQTQAPIPPATQAPIVPQPPVGQLPPIPVITNAGILADVQGTAPQITTTQQDPGLLLIAQSFVERFGSYSNQGRFENFNDLRIFMTDTMWRWVETHKRELEDRYGDFNTYYGIETRVISRSIDSIDDSAGRAIITCKTQRQEFSTATGSPTVYYQDIRLELVRIGGEWKVNGAYWE